MIYLVKEQQVDRKSGVAGVFGSDKDKCPYYEGKKKNQTFAKVKLAG